MAAYLKPEITTLLASADLSAKQFHFVKFVTDDSHVVNCGVAGENSIGVLMNAPDAAEIPAEIAYMGGAKIKLAATVARGGEIQTDANGKGIVALTTKKVLAIAMESGVSGDVIGVKLVNYELN